jgi:hypothetical protein
MTFPGPNTTVQVIKADHEGNPKWTYNGVVIDGGPTWAQIQAFFNAPTSDDGYVVFRTGDRFVEWFYADRGYNIFEIHDVADDHLKGWYCNITRPAIITPTTITWPDLALDIWISPAGEALLLDQDEFASLVIDAETRAAALQAADDLRGRVARREPPFDAIEGAIL